MKHNHNGESYPFDKLSPKGVIAGLNKKDVQRSELGTPANKELKKRHMKKQRQHDRKISKEDLE